MTKFRLKTLFSCKDFLGIINHSTGLPNIRQDEWLKILQDGRVGPTRQSLLILLHACPSSTVQQASLQWLHL